MNIYLSGHVRPTSVLVWHCQIAFKNNNTHWVAVNITSQASTSDSCSKCKVEQVQCHLILLRTFPSYHLRPLFVEGNISIASFLFMVVLDESFLQRNFPPIYSMHMSISNVDYSHYTVHARTNRGKVFGWSKFRTSDNGGFVLDCSTLVIDNFLPGY